MTSPSARPRDEATLPAPARRPATRIARLVPWFVLVVVLALVVTVRWRLLDVPLERDEGEYAYAGQLMLRGIPPYKLAYNLKLPGAYAMYAGFLALFGQTARGVHLGLLLVNLLAIVLLFRLAQRLFGSTAAVVAAATYALLSVEREVLGIFGHATHLIVLWALAGFLVLLTALERGRRRDFFASGLCFGLAFLMKQHAVFFVLFGAVAILVAARRPSTRGSRLVADELAFAGGAALPFALTCVVLAAAGVFPSFWFWVFRYAAVYVSRLPVANGLANLRFVCARILPATPFLWGLAIAGLAVLVADRRLRDRRFIVTAFTIAAALAVCPGLHFRAHYFVVLLPAVALLVGVAMDGTQRALRTVLPAGLAAVVVAVVFVGVFWVSLVPQVDLLLRTPPDRVCRAVYGSEPFAEAVEVARYIRAYSLPTERLAVLGSEPEIYFYADRLSATGYIYMYGLMEHQPYAQTMQRQLIHEVEKTAPAWAVLVGAPHSWTVHTDSDTTVLAWARRYLGACYTRVGVGEIESQDRTVCVWRDSTALEAPRGQHFLAVYRRNPGR